MTKNKRDKGNLQEEFSQGSEAKPPEPDLPFDEVSSLLLSQIRYIDSKLNSYILINFILQLLIISLSIGLIVIGIILAFQYGPGRLKMIFSISTIFIGLISLVYILRINLSNKLILMIKRISQIKVILIGFLKQITYLDQVGFGKNGEEVSQLLSFSKEIVQQTVDDLENPFE